MEHSKKSWIVVFVLLLFTGCSPSYIVGENVTWNQTDTYELVSCVWKPFYNVTGEQQRDKDGTPQWVRLCAFKQK